LTFLQITNPTSQFHKSHALEASQSPFFKIPIFKLKINQQKQKHFFKQAKTQKRKKATKAHNYLTSKKTKQFLF
jgi:hypothetical protein